MSSLQGQNRVKPLNYAYVTVVLDNQDGFIQQAGERFGVELYIYRSGDSEYKIDGKKRYVSEMFMICSWIRDWDGLLLIISQGRVEEIF